jgi:hypothetical protein
MKPPRETTIAAIGIGLAIAGVFALSVYSIAHIILGVW